MKKQFIAILAGTALLGGEAVEGLDKHGLHWMVTSDHNHMEIPEGVTTYVSRPIFDSSATAMSVPTGSISLLKTLLYKKDESSHLL